MSVVLIDYFCKFIMKNPFGDATEDKEDTEGKFMKTPLVNHID